MRPRKNSLPARTSSTSSGESPVGGYEWIVRASGVTSDGDTSGATYVIKPLSQDKIELKTMHKVVGDTVEGDSTSILVRKAGSKKPEPEKK